MRVQRFEPFLEALIPVSGGGVIREVKTFAEAGFKGAGPYGLILTFASGGSLYANIVSSAPPGGDNHTQPETIVEGEPPTPVPLPALELSGGKVRTRDVEQYLRALILNSGNPEVAAVRALSAENSFHKYGMNIEFHRRNACHLYFLQTLPAGRTPRPEQDYQWLEAM
ncbi:hypothetical protein MXD62_16560 [Frankia sp. Mgl5]|uniref:hypothetical protein n=1 Tax=Frankia sp. Mgl5 TaxID=2933793 RepID=UPI00200C2154|nr:hypothetical protein [Frankia sp. Mgl5]MCK9928768.1 hypothetical protein [Frankia sp. Mgl5]